MSIFNCNHGLHGLDGLFYCHSELDSESIFYHEGHEWARIKIMEPRIIRI